MYVLFEQIERLEKVQDHLCTLNSLCSVLGLDFKQIVSNIQPSLGDTEGPKSVTNDTIQQLAAATQNLREVKLQRMQKVKCRNECDFFFNKDFCAASSH